MKCLVHNETKAKSDKYLANLGTKFDGQALEPVRGVN